MKFVFSSALLLGAAQSMAGTPPAAPPAVPAAAKPVNPADRIVCQHIEELGTRLGGQRVCMTVAQWEEQRRRAREDVENSQRHESNPSCC